MAERIAGGLLQDPRVIAAEMPERWDPKVIEGEERWNGLGRKSTMLHFENFQKAIRDRKQPVEDVYAGHRAAAVAAHGQLVGEAEEAGLLGSFAR